MKHAKEKIQHLIGETAAQLKRVIDDTAFLGLKHDELSYGGEFTIPQFLTARQDLEIEKSVLAGKAFELQVLLNKSRMTPRSEVTFLLDCAWTYARPGPIQRDLL